MTKRINKKNVHTQYVRITRATKDRLEQVAFNHKISQCEVAEDILSSNLDEYKTLEKKGCELNKKVANDPFYLNNSV